METLLIVCLGAMSLLAFLLGLAFMLIRQLQYSVNGLIENLLRHEGEITEIRAKQLGPLPPKKLAIGE